MAEQCTCLILKLRGSGFPVKDSGMEGSAVDLFYEVRSNYIVGQPHEGVHADGPLYKSGKIRQDLNPCVSVPSFGIWDINLLNWGISIRG